MHIPKPETILYKTLLYIGMIEIIFLLLLVGLMAASYCDIRTREVPDWLNFSLIFAGFD